MESWINRLHYPQQDAKKTWIWGLFWLAQNVYRFVLLLRGVVLSAWHAWFQTPVRLPVPVVSVGNLTTGGTGKTPVVIALAQGYLAQGLRVLVLHRGYRAKTPIHGPVTSPHQGDEAYEIQQAVPGAHVWVGRKRARMAQQAVAQLRPDVVILDDGFQHVALARDMDIVLVDGRRGLGNGYCLPLGPLREPKTGLRRATHVWWTHTHGHPVCQQAAMAWMPPGLLANKHTGVVWFMPGPATNWKTGQALSEFAGYDVYLASALAQPQPFEAALLTAGAHVVSHVKFDDHHVYTAREMTALFARLDDDPQLQFVTTAKDAVKLQPWLVQQAPEKLKRCWTWKRHALLPELPALGPASPDVCP
jgi:tetraacyldisaccharide 4'-kinase